MTRPNPIAFLSSTVTGLEDLRRQAHAFGQQFGRDSIWVEEAIRPGSAGGLAAADMMLEELERSQIFVALLASNRHGTAVPVDGQDSQVSYFELEIFYAALLQCPVVIVAVGGVASDARLAPLLAALSQDAPRSSVSIVSDLHEAALRVEQIVTKAASGTHKYSSLSAKAYGHLLEWKWRNAPNVAWLGGNYPPGPVTPNLEVIRACLDEASSSASHKEKLARVWIASRELTGVPYWTKAGRSWLPEWRRVLSAYNKAAGWYGLHGHIDLGYLAALNSIRELCSVAVREDDSLRDNPLWQPPYSSMASAYHALGRRVASWRSRRLALSRALALVDLAKTDDRIGEANVLSIKGSILRAQMHFGAAAHAYRRVLRLRQEASAPDGQIGEAMTELGHGLLFLGKWVEGRSLLIEGVQLMEDAGYSAGFLVRAKRKLAMALRLTGAFHDAREQARQARDLATATGIGRAGREGRFV